MRLTLMTDYALRLLMYVAQQPARLCTISEVAQAYDISEAHLMKVTHQLGLLGWIETVRGKGEACAWPMYRAISTWAP